MSPFLELRVQLYIDQSACDRAVAKTLLDLEQVCACLIIMKGMAMPKGVERITPAFPSEFRDAFFEHLGQGRFADVGSRPLSGKEPVIRLCPTAALFPVLVEDLLQTIGKFNFTGIPAFADFFRDRNRTIGKGDVPETKGGDFTEPQGSTVGNGKFRLMFQVLCSEDQLHGFFF